MAARRQTPVAPGPGARLARPRSSSLLPLLLVFGLFSWWPIVRAVVMSVQQTNLVTAPECVGLDNFRAVLDRPAAADRRRATRVWFALLALVFGYPVPLVLAVLMSDVRRASGLYSLLAYLPVVVPPVGGRAAVAVLLRRQPDRGVQHDPRLGRPRPGPVAGVSRDLGDAVAGARGDLGGGRRHRDHLPGRAGRRSRPSCTTRPRSTAPASGARSGTSRCRSCAASC